MKQYPFSFRCLAAVLFFSGATSVFAQPPRLISVAATSQSKGSSDPIEVLSEKELAYWAPGMKDRGAFEGISLRFENPVALGAIDILAEGPIAVSVNGNRLSSFGAPIQNYSGPGHLCRFEIQDPNDLKSSIQVKELFIKIMPDTSQTSEKIPARIYGVYFYGPISSNFYTLSASERLKPVVPELISAEVKASSILTPFAAYQPANLFDSKYDFAWSTYGEKTTGVGESVTIQFASQISVSGFILWNGYQRSENHYQANGRVAELTVESEGISQSISLKDQYGSQTIALPKAIAKTKTLKLTIKKIFKGENYPDILLSEIRILDSRGKILIPKPVRELAQPTEKLSPWINESFNSTFGVALNYIFKIRSDGSFAVYNQADNDSGHQETVWEGGWEENASGLRIFGKRYSTAANWRQMAYGLAGSKSPLEIFQTELRIRDFKTLSQLDQERLVALSLKAHIPYDGSPRNVWTFHEGMIQRQDTESLKKAIRDSLLKTRSIAVESPIFSEIFVPTDSGKSF